MASGDLFHVHNEVLQLQLTASSKAFTVDAIESRFELEEPLVRGISTRNFSQESKTELKELCECLHHAESAIIGTSHSGLHKTPATLVFCVNTALKARNCSLNAVTGSNSDANAADVVRTSPIIHNAHPTVLIVVPTVEHGGKVRSLLSRLKSIAQVSLHIRYYLEYEEFSLSREHETIDIAVCTSGQLQYLKMPHIMGLGGVQLVLWDEAHRLLGPEFRSFRPDQYRPVSFEMISRLRSLRSDVRSVLVGPLDQFGGLCAIGDEVLRRRGMKISLDGRVAPKASPHSSGNRSDVNPSSRLGLVRATFLDLPGAIRNRIYDLAIKSGSIFEIGMFRPAGGKKPCRAVCLSFTCSFAHEWLAFDHELGKWLNTPPNNLLALSRVNMQLAVETRPVFYAANTFHFETMGALNVFIRSIGAPATHLRHISFISRMAFLHTKFSAIFRTMAQLLALESVTIDYQSFTKQPGPRGGKIEPGEFADEIKDYLVCWHDAHKDANGHSKVLQLVKITVICRRCKNALVVNGQCTGASHICPEHSHGPGYARPCRQRIEYRSATCPFRRMRKVKREVRAQIAKVLGLDETMGLPAANSQLSAEHESGGTSGGMEVEDFFEAAKSWLG